MQVELATSTDDTEIRRLLRENPIEGEIRLTLELEPCSLTSRALQGEMHQVVVAREEPGGRLLGMGSRAVAPAWLNGQAQPLGYLGQLRLDRPHRHRLRVVRAGYQLLAELHGCDRVPLYVTTIAEDNHAARRLLEAGLPGLPRYRLLGRYHTLALPVRQRGATRQALAELAAPTRIERAAPEDLPAIAACLQRNGRRWQFHPLWTAEDLRAGARTPGLSPQDFHLARRGGEVVGCAAVWDQRAFKQAVVRGYGRRLALLRPLLNLAAPWIGVPRLPRAGEALRHAFLSHLAADGDEPELVAALVAASLDDAADRRTLDTLVLGLSERSPLLPALATFRQRRYGSILYLVHWEDGADAAATLDDRTPHLETATL